MHLSGQWGNDPLYSKTEFPQLPLVIHTHTKTRYNMSIIYILIYLYGSSAIGHYLLRSPIENHTGHRCVCVCDDDVRSVERESSNQCTIIFLQFLKRAWKSKN